MGEKQEFIKFYMEHKDKYGAVSIEDIRNNFALEKGKQTSYVFEDGTKEKFFVKHVCHNKVMTAELMMSRLYKKLGLDSAIYYPCTVDMRCDHAISQNIIDDRSDVARNFIYKIFERSGDMFPSTFGVKNQPQLTGYYSPQAVRELLVMRLLDTASFNADRHQGNFVLKTRLTEQNTPVVEHIRPFDFGDSADAEHNEIFGKYYTDFVSFESVCNILDRREIVDHFKNNQTVQMFLPRKESFEILKSVDFNTEVEELKDEIGFEANRWLVDRWAESFEDMACELEQ